MAAWLIDGSKIDTLGPKSGVPGGLVVGGAVVGGAVVGGGVPPGRFHCWLAPPVQAQICSGVPSAEDTPVASRHLPDPVFTNWVPLAVHFWALVPLQSYSWTLVPSAVPAPATSKHLPSARTLASVMPTVHCCALLPLQVKSWIWVPFAAFAPVTSTHFPPYPVMDPTTAALAAVMVSPTTPIPEARLIATAALTRRGRRRPARETPLHRMSH